MSTLKILGLLRARGKKITERQAIIMISFPKINKLIKWTFCILFYPILLSGCGSMLTEQGSRIHVTSDYSKIMGCTYLGQITSSSKLRGIGLDESGLNSSLNKLRNKAAQIGANILVIQIVSSDNNITDMVGDAYLCNDL